MPAISRRQALGALALTAFYASLLACGAGNPPAIEWERTFAARASYVGELAIRQTKDGGYILAGTIDTSKTERDKEPGQERILVMKTDNTGKALWSHTLGKPHGACARAVLVTSDGGYLVAGERTVTAKSGKEKSKATEESDKSCTVAYLVKFDRSGDKKWDRYYPAERYSSCRSIAEDVDGSFHIVGAFMTSTTVGPFVLTTDRKGNKKSFFSLAEKERRGIGSADFTRDGGHIVAGWNEYRSSDGVFLLRADQNGKRLWLRTFDASNGQYWFSGGSKNSHWDAWLPAPVCVRQTEDGGFALTACAKGNFKKPGDLLLLKVDSQGEQEWSATFGGSWQDRGIDLLKTRDGGFLVAGLTHSPTTRRQTVYLVRTGANGKQLWATRLGDLRLGYYVAICHTQEGGYAIVGNDDKGISLVKLSPENSVRPEGSKHD
jgi:hypothetical protein